MGAFHLDVPLRLTGTGRFATNDQDSVDDLAACVACVIATPVGSRIEVPEFGTSRPDFGTVRPEEVVAAVQEWEPRVDLTVDVASQLGDVGALTQVTVQVRPHI